MTAMLDSYVSFVKTESLEPIENLAINEIIRECVKNIDKIDCKVIFNEKIQLLLLVDQFKLKEHFKILLIIQRGMQIKLKL